jgi:hypothetical protein
MYHCTIDLLIDLFGLVCFSNKNKNCQLSYSWFQTSHTGGQQYSDTSPFSIPWPYILVSSTRANISHGYTKVRPFCKYNNIFLNYKMVWYFHRRGGLSHLRTEEQRTEQHSGENVTKHFSLLLCLRQNKLERLYQYFQRRLLSLSKWQRKKAL